MKIDLMTPDLPADLRKATDAGELFLLYQPKLNLGSREIVGVEALARWEHPTTGSISPDDFIPAAEVSGCIDWFTEWALRAAIRDWLGWKAQGLLTDLSVNISALTLRNVSFPDLVERLCRNAGMPCEHLLIELTEGATQEAVRLMDTITRFRLKGIRISFDDFGTGYASLTQLRQLPFTELKIDRSFVRDILTSKESLAIVRSLIGLAHELGLTVTAEGPETAEAVRMLVSLGCDNVQGFFIAQPMPANRLSAWIKKSGHVPPGRLAEVTS